MALTGLYGSIAKKDAIAVIHAARDHGIRHFDTAESYGPYKNESLLAEALHARRHDVTVATKIGYKIQDGTIVGIDNTPQALRSSVDGCLRRLRRDRIDLLYLHRVDTRIPIEDTVGVLSEFVAQGKAKAIALSAVDGSTLARAHAVSQIAAVQNEFSLICREANNETLQRALELKISFVAFSPLARGILSGDVVQVSGRSSDDYRRGRAEFSAANIKSMRERLRPLRDIATRQRRTPTEIALAWLLTKSIAAIPGARTAQQVVNFCGALDVQLGATEIAQLEGICASAED